MVKETIKEQKIAKDTVRAMGLNITLASPSTNMIGRNTAMSVRVAAITALPTSEAPVRAASRAGIPKLRWR